MRMLAACSVMLAVSCAQPSEPPKGQSSDPYTLLRAARNRWYLATGVVQSHSERLVVHEKNFDCNHTLVCTGGHSWNPHTIHYSLQSPDVGVTMLHEVGHCYGGSWHHNQVGVMNEYGSHSCITKDDLKHMCSHIECLWEKPEC